ncbi:hypothetical protein QAD02_013885 [Eretmocerus hayati]|uniref:Uncharacterized protein n=1 Tax=Eretmocerus hayati TaxID=131215 RepID=A0ACC2P3Q0_9HYME|nr:hypothetical protein QAD02_013885 [Eretmocerus hayati]
MDSSAKPAWSEASAANPNNSGNLGTLAYLQVPTVIAAASTSSSSLHSWDSMQAAVLAPGTARIANLHPQSLEPTAVRSNAFFRPWESLQAPPSTALETRQQVLETSAVPSGVEIYHARTLASTSMPAAGAKFCVNTNVATTISTLRAISRLEAPAPETSRFESLNLSRLPNPSAQQHLATSSVSMESGNFDAQALVSTSVPAASTPPCVGTEGATNILTYKAKSQLQVPASKTAPVKGLNYSRLLNLTASRKTTRPSNPADASKLPAPKQQERVGLSLEAQTPGVSNSVPLMREENQASDSTGGKPSSDILFLEKKVLNQTGKLDHISGYVNSLEKEVKSCKARSRNELEYVVPREALDEVLSGLSNVYVRGNDRARERKKRLTDKVTKIIHLLDTKVPLLEEQPQPSDQGQEMHAEPICPEDEEQCRAELAQQQVERIREILQEKFGSGEEAVELDDKVDNGSVAESSMNSRSGLEPSPSVSAKGHREWHNDYLYKFDKISGSGTRHLPCMQSGKKSKSCPARLTINKDGNRTVTGIHNHPPLLGGEQKDKFYAALKKAVQTQRTDIKTIYYEVAEDYEDIAIKYPLQKVERQMHRWRSKVRTRGTGKVRTIDDYVTFFETPEGQKLLEYDPKHNRKLSYKLVTEIVNTKKGQKVFKPLALYDEKSLEEHENCTVFQDDATFLSRPKVHGVTQLFTIMARNYDKCFPCVCLGNRLAKSLSRSRTDWLLFSFHTSSLAECYKKRMRYPSQSSGSSRKASHHQDADGTCLTSIWRD